jgi:predicted nucleic acid-binding Zn ribbon protein
MAAKPSLPLACPRCATRYPLDERFCAECGMPLTYAGKVDVEESATGSRAQARRINPEYTRGDLRRVATASQQPEAELIQMMLLEEGVPSTVRRSAGFDVPDFLAAGPRDVLVPESGLAVAREILQQSDILDEAQTAPPGMSTAPGRPAAILLLWLLVASSALGLVIWLVLMINN